MDKVRVLMVKGAEDIMNLGSLGQHLQAAVAVPRLVRDKNFNPGSDRARKPVAKRTDTDWARWLAAQNKRERRGRNRRVEAAERRVEAGGVISLADVEALGLVGPKR